MVSPWLFSIVKKQKGEMRSLQRQNTSGTHIIEEELDLRGGAVGPTEIPYSPGLHQADEVVLHHIVARGQMHLNHRHAACLGLF